MHLSCPLHDFFEQARAAFDTGVGLIIPMYYDYADFDEAYLTDAAGTFSQYMFGPSILVAPIVTPGLAFLGGGLLTSKTVWLPPGSWYSTISGNVIESSSSFVTNNYTIDEIPIWYDLVWFSCPQLDVYFYNCLSGIGRDL
jgi:alpha-glucosidase (family GH31 glycosyl hydrolase)